MKREYILDRVWADDEDDEDEKKQGQMDGLGSKILKARTVLIAGQVDQTLAEKTIAQLLILDADNNEPIKVFVTSQGGHVDSGMAIHDIMRFVNSPVYAVAAGWCASIAVPILMGAKKENRYSLTNTRFLLHQPSGGAGGQLSDIRIEAQEIIKIRKRLNKLLAEETGQSEERITKDSDRNFWMSAEEAMEYGIVSKVVKTAADLPSSK